MNWEQRIRKILRGNKIICTELFTAARIADCIWCNVHRGESAIAKVVHRAMFFEKERGE